MPRSVAPLLAGADPTAAMGAERSRDTPVTGRGSVAVESNRGLAIGFLRALPDFDPERTAAVVRGLRSR